MALKSIVGSVDVLFVGVTSEKAFQDVFSSPRSSAALEDWIASDPSRLDLLNLYLRYRFDAFVKATVKAWVQDAFQGKQQTWLLRLRWPVLYRPQCLEAVQALLQEKISTLCEGGFDEKLTDELQVWLESRLLPFCVQLLPSTPAQDIHTLAMDMFVETRSQKLFEMIADYPDSQPALASLRDHLTASPVLLAAIGRDLRATIEQRLLHLAVSTSTILDYYVTMMAALRQVDGSESLLHFVSQPLRSYLKHRKDSIRAVLLSLTESSSDLHSALKHGKSLVYGVQEEEEEEEGTRPAPPPARTLIPPPHPSLRPLILALTNPLLQVLEYGLQSSAMQIWLLQRAVWTSSPHWYPCTAPQRCSLGNIEKYSPTS